MTRLLYRIAAVLIFLFALGHSIGYPWSDPQWGVDLHAVQSSHFNVLGSNRSYWDFYLGFGLFNSMFMLLAAVLAWQLGNLPAASARFMSWMLALCFAAVTALSWMYFFIIPIVFSILITVCLLAAAWRTQTQTI